MISEQEVRETLDAASPGQEIFFVFPTRPDYWDRVTDEYEEPCDRTGVIVHMVIDPEHEEIVVGTRDLARLIADPGSTITRAGFDRFKELSRQVCR